MSSGSVQRIIAVQQSRSASGSSIWHRCSVPFAGLLHQPAFLYPCCQVRRSVPGRTRLYPQSRLLAARSFPTVATLSSPNSVRLWFRESSRGIQEIGRFGDESARCHSRRPDEKSVDVVAKSQASTSHGRSSPQSSVASSSPPSIRHHNRPPVKGFSYLRRIRCISVVGSTSSIQGYHPTVNYSSIHVVGKKNVFGGQKLGNGRPNGSSFTTALVAGTIAGLAASTATYPIAVVQKRMQSEDRKCARRKTGAWQMFAQIIEEEGVGGLYKGIRSHCFSTVLAHATAFITYEIVKVHSYIWFRKISP
ncbi:unnamed protein product [Linum tenue]|uniref:Uncharacterized protein n=1 Tax=Linum tenue TaxID=586396 RepID=A0AAV0QUJ3_9ROSI|nr:unnamed protein product [Linum tenue]